MANYDLYNARVGVFGTNIRDRLINETKNTICRQLMSHPSLRDVKIGTAVNKIDGKLVIISTSDPNVNQITSLPNETFSAGQYVEFAGGNWLINKSDVDDEIYVDGQMTLCPNTLKFQDSHGNIFSYPYFIDTSSSSLDSNKLIVTSDSTRKIKLPFDEHTKNFFIDKRFMGEVFNGIPQCWKITDLDAGSLLIVTLEKDEFNKETDRIEYGLCDYIKPNIEPDTPIESGYCEITFSGKAEIKVGGSTKTFTAKFYNLSGVEVYNVTPIWVINNTYDGKVQIKEEVNNTIKISVINGSDLIGNTFMLNVSDVDKIYSNNLEIKMIPLL